MRKHFPLLLISTLFSCGAFAQNDSINVDSLMAHYVKSYYNGVLRLQPDVLTPGQLFTTYKSYFMEGDDHEMELIKSWTDDNVGMSHYRYQQVYQDLRVEGAVFTEHADDDGYVLYAKGKVSELDADLGSMSYIDETTAWDILIGVLDPEDAYDWAWEDEDLEDQLQNDSGGDPSATYYPLGQGELLWALEDYRELGANIPTEKYRLAWYFDVQCVDPDFHNGYFVDAETGEVFREITLRHYDGVANTFTYGNQTIDTKYRGFPNNDYILQANTDGRDFETRYYSSSDKWILADKVDDADDQWYTANRIGTTSHYHVQRSWDYFKNTHGRDGFDDDGIDIRVFVDMNSNSTRWALDGKKNYIYIGESGSISHSQALDMVAHEYTHGIIYYTAQLPYQDEPGALNESFSDIFGVLIESEEEGSINWSLFENSGYTNPRSMSNPNSGGRHVADGNCNLAVGQPDTYEGTHWYDGWHCDWGGVHVNSGVQNHWFYLLVTGGSGTNDHNDGYSVSGIGLADAEELVFYSLTNLVNSSDEYVDAREASILAAEILHGECSNIYQQVINAWYAVGVGAQHSCPPANTTRPKREVSWHVYPNPAKDRITVICNDDPIQSLQVLDMAGNEIVNVHSARQHSVELPLSGLPSGQYIITMKTNNSVQYKKLIIN